MNRLLPKFLQLAAILLTVSLGKLEGQDSSPGSWSASITHGPPTLCIGEIKDGELHLEVARPYTVTTEENYVVEVPVSEEVNGRQVTRTVQETRTRTVEKVYYRGEVQVRQLDEVWLTTPQGEPIVLLDNLQNRAWRGLLIDNARVLDDAFRPFYRNSNVIVVGSSQAPPVPAAEKTDTAKQAAAAEREKLKEIEREKEAQAQRQAAAQAEREFEAQVYQERLYQRQLEQQRYQAQQRQLEQQRRYQYESLRRAAEQEAAEAAREAVRDYNYGRYNRGGGY